VLRKAFNYLLFVLFYYSELRIRLYQSIASFNRWNSLRKRERHARQISGIRKG